jgi:hypothetical protein
LKTGAGAVVLVDPELKVFEDFLDDAGIVNEADNTGCNQKCESAKTIYHLSIINCHFGDLRRPEEYSLHVFSSTSIRTEQAIGMQRPNGK